MEIIPEATFIYSYPGHVKEDKFRENEEKKNHILNTSKKYTKYKFGYKLHSIVQKVNLKMLHTDFCYLFYHLMTLKIKGVFKDIGNYL
jgi:hypothetical protein